MRQLVAAALLVTTLFAPGTSLPLHAAPGDPTESPSQQLMASPRPGASDVGWIWTVGTNPSATHLMRRVGLRDGSYQTWIECDSVDDPDCAPVDQAALSGQIVIGHCASDTEIGCVDALAIDGVELSPAGHIGDDNVLPEDTERGIPRGASHPMWTASDGSIYILANKIEYEYAAVDGEWQASPATVEFSLRRAAAGSIPVAPRAWLADSPDPSLSILALDDMDIDEIELDPSDMIELELRLPASISGWFHGRLDAAAVSQIASNDDVITYAIAARPMEVQVAGGWFDPADLSAAGREQLYGPRIPTPGEVGVGGAGDPGSSLSQFRVLEPLLGQQAFSEIVQWAFRSASSGDGPTCGQDVPGLTGIISSNAAVYDGRLPSWNAETETLEIEIGSPHLASDGTEAVGSYTASLPDDLVDCLWELGTAPAIAELDVGYDDESVTSGGALTSADGWVNVDVEGFHYSTPSVGLRLSEREPSGGSFESLTPSRILDTRGSDPVGELDGSGDAFVLQVTGVGGVPSSGVSAVALNVTVVDGQANDFGGFVTVFPCGTRPDASNLNFVSGQTVPNSVIAPLSASGTVCLYVYGQADLLVDVSGYFVSGFEPLTPDRILDTRGSDPVGELDGSGDAYTLQVTGGDVPESATAVALNVTVVDGEANDFGGFVTVFPCGTRPDASNLNFVSGQTVPNSVIAPLSASGTVCLYVYGVADLLVDVSGYFTSGFTPQVPDRILDTRSSDPVGELDGSGDAYTLQVTGSTVPASATAVALNVTVVDGQANDFGGFVTVYPCGTRPDASNLNFISGQTVPNSVIAPLSATGTVCLYVYGQADLLVDVSGHL